MTNFDIFLSTPQFEPFAFVAVSAERILQIALSAPSGAPLPKGEARGLPQVWHRNKGDKPCQFQKATQSLKRQSLFAGK